MWRHMLLAALMAGAAGGLIVTMVQQWQVAPLILEAETYEQAVAEAGSTAGGQPQSEAHAAPPQGADSEHQSWAPDDGVERILFTALANILLGIGVALLLVACFALRGEVNWQQGILWGLAGFATFALAPALGLAPEVPGAAAAELALRQLWWFGTVVATALGLAVLAFGRRWWMWAAAAVVLAVPHLIGSPHPAQIGGAVPAELAAAFVVASLFSMVVFWIVLGGLSAHLYRRLVAG